MRRLTILAILVLAVPVAAGDLQLSERLADIEVVDGMVVIDGVEITADEFVQRVDDLQGDRDTRGTLFRALDITGPLGGIMVGLGLFGQVLFTGRMVVQWLASEKEKKSVVPPVFWWMSFGGASLLLTYFIWRIDIVGILGQCTGFAIYARNLWLIYWPGGDRGV
ncbi:MAG: lipid-A-disaccharide synthase N-terminal domain-containing protein [Planctomycetota bacterium]